MNDEEKEVWGTLKLLGYEIGAVYDGWITFKHTNLPLVKVEKLT